MDNYLKIPLLVLSILILDVSFVHPQSQECTFRHLTTKDGLPSNSINTLIKGSDGFMWFATDNGLARYDGYNIKVYHIPGDSISSGNSQVIHVVFEDNKANLWIGTEERGLLLFDRITESFTTLPDYPDSLHPVNTISQDREGMIWIGTNCGLKSLDLETSRFTPYNQIPQDTLNLYNKITTILEDKTGILWIGTHDGVFLFDRNGDHFTRVELPAKIPIGIWRIVSCIIEDKFDRVWIGTYWGLFRYNPVTNEIETISDQDILRHSVVTSIAEDSLNTEHGCWIATQFGLFHFYTRDERIEEFYQDHEDPESLSSDLLKHLYLDNNGQLWIATFTQGIDIFNTSIVPFYQIEVKNLYSGLIWQPISFCIDANNELWVGALDGGLFHYDEGYDLISNYNLWEFDDLHYDPRHNDRITCIYEESGTELLIGFYEWGLIRFNKVAETFKQVELIPALESPIQIDHIRRDKGGTLWVGTNQGLFREIINDENDSLLRVVEHQPLSRADILSIFEDKRGFLWISTRGNGSFLLKKDSTQYINPEDSTLDFQAFRSFFGDYIRTFYEDSDNVLWIGTNKGLNKYNPTAQRFEPVDTFNDKFNGEIIKILGDDQDNLWIFHTTHGLLRFNKTDSRNNVKKFDVIDGLPFDQFNTKYFNTNSFYQSRDGRLFMGCDVGSREGFFWFHPDSIRDNKKAPDVYLTEFKVGNEKYILDSNITVINHITLKYDQNFFSFEFAALNYLNSEKNQYAYYLEGYEENWIYSGNRRFANYTGVPPGEYIFRVKGSNNDGYWNETGASVAITVLPPPWKTWWAYTIYGLICLFIIYSIIYYYLRRQRLLANLALEKLEAEKLKELDGLKTRFFTNISHEFRTPLTLILGPLQKLFSKTTDEESKQDIAIMQRNARRLHNLINQLLDLSKLESGKMELNAREENLVELVKSYVQQFESLAWHKGITLVFRSEQEEIKAFMDRDKIEKILYNLLSNAFKFTDVGGKIQVATGILSAPPQSPPFGGEGSHFVPPDLGGTTGGAGKEQYVLITISDTGAGIPPEKLPHIFDRFYQAGDSYTKDGEGTGIGLALTKELVELHGGTITVESVVNRGSKFRVYLPLGNEDLKSKSKEHKSKIKSISSEHEEPAWTSTLQYEPIPQNAEPGTRNAEPLLLIVEDNPDMRTFIRGYFEDSYQVLEAENGEAGFISAIEHIPDIIISDVMMPRMDGYEFCQKIKTDEKTSHIPMILLTARASKESRLEGLETGADDFITKPFDGEELQVRVKNLVCQRKKLSEHYQKGFELIRGGSAEQTLSMDEKFLKKAQSVVEANLTNPDFSVESFADEMAMSRVQLYRKLRALVNQSVSQFILTIRLNYAIHLLKNKSGTVTEIAYDAGFNSPTYFTLSFKKKYGMSPSDYLKQLGSN